MRPSTSSKTSRATGVVRMAGVVLMLGLWLALVAFSTCGRLHQAICEHAQQSADECVVATFAKQQPWMAVAAPAIQPPLIDGCLFLAPVCTPVHSPGDVRLDLGRAPPALLLPS